MEVMQEPRHRLFQWLSEQLLDRRLDWDVALGLAIDCYGQWDREADAETPSREILKRCPRFMSVRMAGLCVTAFDLLRSVYITKTGKVLTNADLDALADEAEAGYDVSRFTPSRTTPEEFYGGSMSL